MHFFAKAIDQLINYNEFAGRSVKFLNGIKEIPLLQGAA